MACYSPCLELDKTCCRNNILVHCETPPPPASKKRGEQSLRFGLGKEITLYYDTRGRNQSCKEIKGGREDMMACLLYTSPSPRD